MDGHRARKRFGQNFLADARYIGRIVDAVNPRPGDNIVDVVGNPALVREIEQRLQSRNVRLLDIEAIWLRPETDGASLVARRLRSSSDSSRAHAAPKITSRTSR